MIPKRAKRPKMGLRESSVVRCQSHLRWVRGHECSAAKADGAVCEGRIEAHHLQSFRAIEGGMGMKVGDDKCVPLCSYHHCGIHLLGQPEFEHKFRLSLEATAADMWKASPHRHKYELGQRAVTRAPDDPVRRITESTNKDEQKMKDTP